MQSLLCGSAVTLTHDRSVIGSHESDRRADVPFDSNVRTFARHPSTAGKYPKIACAIVDLIDPLAQHSDRLGHTARNAHLKFKNFFVLIFAPLRIANFGSSPWKLFAKSEIRNRKSLLMACCQIVDQARDSA